MLLSLKQNPRSHRTVSTKPDIIIITPALSMLPFNGSTSFSQQVSKQSSSNIMTKQLPTTVYYIITIPGAILASLFQLVSSMQCASMAFNVNDLFRGLENQWQDIDLQLEGSGFESNPNLCEATLVVSRFILSSKIHFFQIYQKCF